MHNNSRCWRENSSSDRKSKCWFEISLFLPRFHSPVDVRRRTNQFNRFFIWFAFAERQGNFFFDEGKVWKVSQSIFSSDNDDDENKRKVDEKFIVNCGACWGLMWVWFPLQCLDVKCRVLIIFLIYSKTFVQLLRPPTVLLQPPDNLPGSQPRWWKCFDR